MVPNKKFWKTVRSYFSDKDNNSSKITLIENNTIVSDEEKIADLMNEYFISIIKNLNLKLSACNATTDIDSIIRTFENHIRIKMTKSTHRRCSINKGILNISQNSLENTCARGSF